MDTKTEDIIEENASATEEDTEEGEVELEKSAPPRKPRTQKQIAAFDKARAALAVKRAHDKELKESNKKPIGRPKKAATAQQQPASDKVPKRRGGKAQGGKAQGGRKQTMIYVDDSHSDESSDGEPESIVVRRRRKKKKPKKKKAQQVIYISESDSGDSSESDAPPDDHYPQQQQQFHFV